MNNFCTEANLENPTCYKVQAFEFQSEEQILDILLDILRSELPSKLQGIKDCEGNPMFISEENIDLFPPTSSARFSIVLNPTTSDETYKEPPEPYFKQATFNFEVFLTVENSLKCVTWELIRFKNAVMSLLVGAELYIDGFDSAVLDDFGFTHFIPGEAGRNSYYRQGSIRFSVTVTQQRI